LGAEGSDVGITGVEVGAENGGRGEGLFGEENLRGGGLVGGCEGDGEEWLVGRVEVLRQTVVVVVRLLGGGAFLEDFASEAGEFGGALVAEAHAVFEVEEVVEGGFLEGAELADLGVDAVDLLNARTQKFFV
jgi:hypothetical protein